MILVQTVFVTVIVIIKVNDRNKNEITMEKNNITKTVVSRSLIMLSFSFFFFFLVLYLVSLKLVTRIVNERQNKRKKILKKSSVKGKALYSRAKSLRNSALELFQNKKKKIIEEEEISFPFLALNSSLHHS